MTEFAAINTHRYEHVDSLRGIAALLVIWLHVTEVFKRIPAVRLNGDLLYRIAEAIDVGRVGVVIFFAISGFVICSSLKGPLLTSTGNFAIKRFLRLYPAYWLAVPLGAWSSWSLWSYELPAGLLLANFSMLPSVFGYPNMMGLLWTLETELIFYFLCLLLFWMRQLNNSLALVVVCFLLLVLYGCYQQNVLPQPASFVWLHMPYHLCIMFWGGMARICHDNPLASVRILSRNVKVSLLLKITAVAILLPLTLAAALDWHATGKTKDITLAAAYFAGIAIFFIGTFHLKLRHRFFVWLGTISYSMYLFHSVFFTPMYWWARTNPQHPLSQLHMGIYLAVTIILTIGFAHAVYQLIEAPCNRLARWLVARRSQPRGSQSHV